MPALASAAFSHLSANGCSIQILITFISNRNAEVWVFTREGSASLPLQLDGSESGAKETAKAIAGLCGRKEPCKVGESTARCCPGACNPARPCEGSSAARQSP